MRTSNDLVSKAGLLMYQRLVVGRDDDIRAVIVGSLEMIAELELTLLNLRTSEEVRVEAEDHLTIWRVLADPENGVPNLSKSEQKLEREIRRDADMYVSGADAILRMLTPTVPPVTQTKGTRND